MPKENKDKIHVKFEQGDIIGRNGRVGVTFNSAVNELYISGNAVTIFKANLAF